MRYYEFALLEDQQYNFEVVGSKVFFNNAYKFASDYQSSGFAQLLLDFVGYKRTASPREGWGRKDAPYQNTYGGYPLRHAHVIYGQAIVVYEYDYPQIRLLRVVDHPTSDDTKSSVKYAKSLGPQDFSPLPENFLAEFLTTPTEREPALPKNTKTRSPPPPRFTADQVVKLKKIYRILAKRYPDRIDAFLRGRPKLFMKSARLLLGLAIDDESRDRDITGILGGWKVMQNDAHEATQRWAKELELQDRSLRQAQWNPRQRGHSFTT